MLTQLLWKFEKCKINQDRVKQNVVRNFITRFEFWLSNKNDHLIDSSQDGDIGKTILATSAQIDTANINDWSKYVVKEKKEDHENDKYFRKNIKSIKICLVAEVMKKIKGSASIIWYLSIILVEILTEDNKNDDDDDKKYNNIQ